MTIRTTGFAVLLAAGLLFPSHSNASFWTGDDLLKACNSPASVSYLYGFLDSYNAAKEAFKLEGGLCVSNRVSGGQIRAIVCDFIDANEDKQHYPAAVLTVEALNQAYPCN